MRVDSELLLGLKTWRNVDLSRNRSLEKGFGKKWIHPVLLNLSEVKKSK